MADRYGCLQLSRGLYRCRSQLLLLFSVAMFGAGAILAHTWRNDHGILVLFLWAPTVYGLAVSVSGRHAAANLIAQSPLFLLVGRKKGPDNGVGVLELDQKLIASCACHPVRLDTVYYRAVGTRWQLATAGRELNLLINGRGIRDGVVEVSGCDLEDFRNLCSTYGTQTIRFSKLLALCSALIVCFVLFTSGKIALTVFAIVNALLIAFGFSGDISWHQRKSLIGTNTYLPPLANWHFHVYKQCWTVEDSQGCPFNDAGLRCECGKRLVIDEQNDCALEIPK